MGGGWVGEWTGEGADGWVQVQGQNCVNANSAPI